MTKPESQARLKRAVSRLSAQNRRYRELVQNLSSAIDILRAGDRLEQDAAPTLQAFEHFAERPQTATGEPTDDAPSARPIEDLKPLAPNPGWKCLAVDLPQIRIGFTLFGMTSDGIEDAVRVVEQRQVRSRDFTPVFVVDTPVFAPFRRRGYVVEYISNETSPKVVRRRFDFIVAKWGLGKTVDLGQSPGSGTE